eukprot:Sdes_comp20152_c0_seq2m13279
MSESDLKSFVFDNVVYYLVSRVESLLGKPSGYLARMYPSATRRQASCLERSFLLSKEIIRPDEGSITYIIKASDVLSIMNDDEQSQRLRHPPLLFEFVNPEEKLDPSLPAKHDQEVRHVIQPQCFYPSSEPLMSLDGGQETSSNYDAVRYSTLEKIKIRNYSSELSRRIHNMPIQKRREFLREWRNPLGPQFISARKQINQKEDPPENLIPIRLELESDGYKLQDIFVWNASDSLVTPTLFAEMLCVDMQLPRSSFVRLIEEAIHMQIEEHRATSLVGCALTHDLDQRVVLKLNVQVGCHLLEDQFEWDLSEFENDPDDFARLLCRDLGLGGEYCSIIAHNIREQLCWHYKGLLQGSYLSEQLPPVEFPPLRDGTKKPSLSVRARDRLGLSQEDLETWGPIINSLTEQDLEKLRNDKEREQRRLRRSTGGNAGVGSSRRDRRSRNFR